MLCCLLSNLFERLILIHFRRSTPWIISDVFFQSSILEITCFKSCLLYLTLKFWMMLASLGCNWKEVSLGKSTSLMFLRFPWRVPGWDGALSRKRKTFRFSTSSLGSKAVRTWIMISVVIHAFLMWKYCIPYGLEGLGNFWKHRRTLLFPKKLPQ